MDRSSRLFRVMIIAAAAALPACAPKEPEVISSADLAVLVGDPLFHTSYLGSDEEYHYLLIYQGDASGSDVRIPVADARVEPAGYPPGERSDIVSAWSEEGVIRLVTPRN